MRKQWTQLEEDLIREGYKEESDVYRLAELLGRSKQAIKHKASRIGVKVRDGRLRIRKVGNQRYWYYCEGRNAVFEHRRIMERKIGRNLTSEDVVHHLDGDTLNNDPNNLVLTTRSEHMGKYHLDICLEKLRKINNR